MPHAACPCPCPYASRCARPDFKKDYYATLEDLFASPLHVPRELPAAAMSAPRSLSWLHLMRGFLCERPLEWKERVVVLEGSACFLHNLWLNPSLRQEFASRFGSPEGLFAELFWKLLPPHPELMREVQRLIGS